MYSTAARSRHAPENHGSTRPHVSRVTTAWCCATGTPSPRCNLEGTNTGIPAPMRTSHVGTDRSCSGCPGERWPWGRFATQSATMATAGRPSPLRHSAARGDTLRPLQTNPLTGLGVIGRDQHGKDERSPRSQPRPGPKSANRSRFIPARLSTDGRRMAPRPLLGTSVRRHGRTWAGHSSTRYSHGF